MSDAALSLGPLNEIILYVSDMDAQVRFYRDALGLKVSYPSGVENYSDQFWVTFDTGACTLALHAGGEKRLGEDAPKFVFEVADVSAAREKCRELAIPVSEIRSPAPGVTVLDARDPEGNHFSMEARC